MSGAISCLTPFLHGAKKENLYFCTTFTQKQNMSPQFYIPLLQMGLVKLSEIIKAMNFGICKYVKQFAKIFMGHFIMQTSYIRLNMSAGILININFAYVATTIYLLQVGVPIRP
jgi:hypothetical protein